MKLRAKDFVPEKTKGGLFKSGSVQTFDEVLETANAWIAKETSLEKIVNVETVVLPNIHERDEEGSQDTELWIGGESSAHWYQLVRVWYWGD